MLIYELSYVQIFVVAVGLSYRSTSSSVLVLVSALDFGFCYILFQGESLCLAALYWLLDQSLIWVVLRY